MARLDDLVDPTEGAFSQLRVDLSACVHYATHAVTIILGKRHCASQLISICIGARRVLRRFANRQGTMHEGEGGNIEGEGREGDNKSQAK